MPKITIEVESGMLDTPAVYDPETETLQLTFKSNKKTYHYSPVSLQMFGEFQKAQSRGSFFLRHIRANGDIKAVLQEEKQSEEAVSQHF